MALSVALVLVLAAGGTPSDCVAYQDELPFRTCFNPGERIEVGVGPTLGNEPAAGRLSLALRLRKNRRGHHDPGLLWNRDHAILETSLDLPWRATPAQMRVESTAYQAVYMRRYEEGALVIPFSTPLRIPFPFDIGMEVEAGRVEWTRADPHRAELGVLRAAPVVDAARRIPFAYRFAFGPELSYSMGIARDEAPRHRLVPFTGGVLDARFESGDGLWALQVQGRAGWQLEVMGPSRFAFSARVELERTIIAVNDWPLAPVVRFEADNSQGPTRLVAQAGLRFAAPL